MASEAVASSATEGLTPAQKLMQEHADHHVTVEDVPDEDELAHAPASDTAAPLSEKAAGKQKADDAPAAPKKRLLLLPGARSLPLSPPTVSMAARPPSPLPPVAPPSRP